MILIPSHKYLIGAGLLLCVLLVAVTVLAQNSYTLPRAALSGGGCVALHSGSYRLGGALGQPVAGAAGGASGRSLCSGLWSGGSASYLVYLPLTLRRSP